MLSSLRGAFLTRRPPIVPAPYALPRGVPALQADPVRQRRRALLAAAGGAAALAWLWRGVSGPSEPLPAFEPLLAAALRHVDDPAMRAALQGLAESALEDPSHASARLAQALARSFDLADHPELRTLAERLRRHPGL